MSRLFPPSSTLPLLLLAAALLARLAAPGVVVRAQTTPASGSAAVPGAVRVKFTFWNVQWFPGRSPNAKEVARARQVAAVAPVVRRLDPDVLGLEEVANADAARLLTDGLPGGYRVDVVTDFRQETGGPTRQQTVLASRLPLVNGWWESWRPAADGGPRPRRGFAFAAYQPAPGQVLLVYALHLKSNRLDEPGGAAVNAAMRAESIRQLLVHARAMAAAYAKLGTVTVVLGGDLNTSLDDPRFATESSLRELLRDGYRWAFQNTPVTERVTLPGGGGYPDVTFDHVFFRTFGPAAAATTPTTVRLLDAGVEPTGPECSDHRPVSATLELKKG